MSALNDFMTRPQAAPSRTGRAAALLLARAGMRVTVLERQPHVGGRTSTLTADGFRFDRGPTFFLYPQVLESIFKAVRRDLWREVSLVRLDPQYSLIFGGGGVLHATPDVRRMQQAIAALCPADAASFPGFLADNRVKRAQFKPCLEQPFLGGRDLFSWRMLRLLPWLRPWRSLDGELARYFSHPRVRLAFSFHSKYLGMSPYRCPGLFSILSFLEYEHGVYHPIGGCGAVMECMARIAGEMGVEVRLGEEVQEILFHGRRATGVRTPAGRYAADALVLNADFARAMTRLVPDHLRRRWTDRRIARKRFSCSTFMLYLGIEGRCDDLPHHPRQAGRWGARYCPWCCWPALRGCRRPPSPCRPPRRSAVTCHASSGSCASASRCWARCSTRSGCCAWSRSSGMR